MKRSTLQAILASLTLVAVIAGCSGGSSSDDDDDAGDDDDDGQGAFTLADGTYVGENSVENANDCGFAATLDGLSLGVTVVGTAVNLSNGLVLTRNGDALTGGGSGTAGIGATCTVDLVVSDVGVVTSDNAFHVREMSDLSNPVGAGCASFSIPCSIDIDADFVRQ